MAIAINGSSNTITGLAVGGLPDASVTAADLASGLASQGITTADLWRVTSTFTSNAGVSMITSNWERCDTSGFGQLGTGMTQSSGVFTFPSTGIYLIHFGAFAHDTGSSSTVGIHIRPTVDGGSNYTVASGAYFSIPNVSTYSYGSAVEQHIFDVTDVSTHKMMFYVYSDGDVTWEGSTSSNSVYAVFTRLGDT